MKEFTKKWLAIDEPPTILYHYADINALHSILDNKKIWCGYVKHSNDKSEFAYGIQLFIDELKKYKDISTFSYDNFIKLLNEEKNNPKLMPFIFCISEKKDLLSQWRGYANFGKGVSLGIDVKKLVKGPCIVLKVVYNMSDQQQIVSDLIKDFITAFDLKIKNNKYEIVELSNDILTLIQAIIQHSLSFKNEAFSEEAEWRVAYFINPKMDQIEKDGFKVKTRTKDNHKIILYNEIDIEINWIREIILGPISCPETNQSLKILKDLNRYSYDIEFSKIPFHS